MKKITRIDAEHEYADAIVQHGNPKYFIFKVIRKWDDDVLLEELEGMGSHDLEIIDEEDE